MQLSKHWESNEMTGATFDNTTSNPLAGSGHINEADKQRKKEKLSKRKNKREKRSEGRMKRKEDEERKK